MQHDVPREILYYTETDEYKKRVRSLRFENTIFVLIIVSLLVLSFYMGRVYESNIQIKDFQHKQVKKTAKDAPKFVRIPYEI